MTGMQDQMQRDAAGSHDPKAAIKRGTPLMDMAEELVKLKEEIDAEAEELKNKRARYKELAEIDIPEEMAACGMVGPDGKGSFTLATGEKLHIRNDLYAGYKKDVQDEVFEWLRERGDDGLIKATVHAGTFKAYIKELMEKGESPPNFVNVHPFQSITVRRR